MNLKAVIFDIEQGQNEIVLNEVQAKQLDLGLMDRVRLLLRRKETNAIVDHCEQCVKYGEIGLFTEVAKALGAKKGDRISVDLAKRPESLDFIRKKLDGTAEIPRLAVFRSLGRPFWMAGSYAHPERLRYALSQGAVGVQVGTAFWEAPAAKPKTAAPKSDGDVTASSVPGAYASARTSETSSDGSSARR